MRFCLRGGWVVPETTPVPVDPSDYEHRGSPDVVGCNRLQCDACGARVAQRIADDGASRIYTCDCTTHDAVSRRMLGDDDRDPGEAVLPWRCGGHPEATLPVDVDGLSVDESTDVAEVVARALAGWTPAGARPNAAGLPAGWITRLYSRLEGLPAAGVVAGAMGAVLAGEDRGTALRFYWSRPRAAGFEAVLDIPGSEWAKTWPTPYLDRTFQQSPLQAILARLASVPATGADDVDRAVASRVREELLARNPAAGSDWFAGLAGVDPDAFVAVAPAFARLRGAYVGMMLTGLVDSDQAALALVVGYALIDARAGRGALKKWVARPEHRRRSYAVMIQRRLDRPKKKR